MRILSIAEQMNACIKHANRKGLTIHNVEIDKKPLDNHNVTMVLGDLRNGMPYISVAILVNMKNDGCDESTWDVGRN